MILSMYSETWVPQNPFQQHTTVLASCYMVTPQWGAADAEIKVPSVENTELDGSPFKAWGM